MTTAKDVQHETKHVTQGPTGRKVSCTHVSFGTFK